MKLPGGPNINCGELKAEEMSIGERAAFVIRMTAALKDIPIQEECEIIGVDGKTYDHWHKRGRNPYSYFIGQMALAGYDIYWILTGKEQEHGCKV